MVDKKYHKWIHGFFTVSQHDFQFVCLYEPELLKFLQSGKNVKVRDCTKFFLTEEEGDKKVG